MWTSVDRWTCPHKGCNRTVVIDASELDTAAAIDAVRTRHYNAHRAADAASAQHDRKESA